MLEFHSLQGPVAQSGSAPRSHRGGQGFKSPQVHRQDRSRGSSGAVDEIPSDRDDRRDLCRFRGRSGLFGVVEGAGRRGGRADVASFGCVSGMAGLRRFPGAGQFAVWGCRLTRGWCRADAEGRHSVVVVRRWRAVIRVGRPGRNRSGGGGRGRPRAGGSRVAWGTHWRMRRAVPAESNIASRAPAITSTGMVRRRNAPSGNTGSRSVRGLKCEKVSITWSRAGRACGESRPATAHIERSAPQRPKGRRSRALNSQPIFCRPTPPGHSRARRVTRSGRRVA